jgi:hypothetical protein
MNKPKNLSGFYNGRKENKMAKKFNFGIEVFNTYVSIKIGETKILIIRTPKFPFIQLERI